MPILSPPEFSADTDEHFKEPKDIGSTSESCVLRLLKGAIS